MGAVLNGEQQRAFRYAVLISLALHALLLVAVSSQIETLQRQPPAAAIPARLVDPPVAPLAAPPRQPPPLMKPAPPTPRPPVPVKPPPVRKTPAATVAKPQPEAPALPAPASPPKPPPPAAGAPSEAQAVPAPAPEPREAATPPVPVAPAFPSEAAPPVATATPEQAAPAAETLDSGTLAQYRLQLISAARKYKRYPRVAMDNNWEGEVVVRMVVGANGAIRELTIQTSSGHGILDRQALEMFERAKPLVQIPAALRGKEFAVELRAIYTLRDQGSG